ANKKCPGTNIPTSLTFTIPNQRISQANLSPHGDGIKTQQTRAQALISHAIGDCASGMHHCDIYNSMPTNLARTVALGAAALFAIPSALAQPATQTLLATPATVAWG